MKTSRCSTKATKTDRSSSTEANKDKNLSLRSLCPSALLSLDRHSLYDSIRCRKAVGHAPVCRCFWHELKYAELRISLLTFLVIFAFFSGYQNWSLEAQGCTVESFRRFLKMKWALVSHAGLTLLVCIGLGSCNNNPNPSLVDDAGGRKPEDLPEIAEDVFKPMDGGIELSPDEIKGRNTWNLWCAGTEQFWERMSRESYGLIDLLKTIDSRGRTTRFKQMALINEPGYNQADKPDQYGLWIEEAVEAEPPAIDPKVYGRSSGIMGFRIFENPDFKGEAVKNWDADRYYNDSNYAVDPQLIRPYRVGISCGSCHIAFHPCNPPDEPEDPKWLNLASAIGNEYIRESAVISH